MAFVLALSVVSLWISGDAGGTWSQVRPLGGSPRDRSYHSAVFDASSRHMLVFGGFGNDDNGNMGVFNDVVRYDVAGNSWISLAPSGLLPEARDDHSAVFDESSRHMLVFGGFRPGNRDYYYLNDLWRYDAAGNTWTSLNASGGPPSRRCGHRAVFDASSRHMLVFGGAGFKDEYYYHYNDLWRYDLAGNTWARVGNRLDRRSRPPRPRQHHSVTFDASNRHMLVFGGSNAYYFLDDLWRYDAVADSWTALRPSGPRPAARAGHSAAFDASRRQMLVFGGFSFYYYMYFYRDHECFNDLWSYDPAGNTWMLLVPSGEAPAARAFHSTVFDARSRQMWIFAGNDDFYYYRNQMNDLWWYDQVEAPTDAPTTLPTMHLTEAPIDANTTTPTMVPTEAPTDAPAIPTEVSIGSLTAFESEATPIFQGQGEMEVSRACGFGPTFIPSVFTVLTDLLLIVKSGSSFGAHAM